MSTNIRSCRTVAKLRYCGGICPRNGDTVVVRGTVGPVSSAGRAFVLQAGGSWVQVLHQAHLFLLNLLQWRRGKLVSAGKARN